MFGQTLFCILEILRMQVLGVQLSLQTLKYSTFSNYSRCLCITSEYVLNLQKKNKKQKQTATNHLLTTKTRERLKTWSELKKNPALTKISCSRFRQFKTPSN